jgi:diketogulonate reductase-like aldo/keto reductase
MNRLSISGNKVKLPTIGLGTMGFGGYFKRNQEDPKAFIEVIEYSVDCGMSLLDTAEGYAEGGAEEIIGMVSKSFRDRLFIMSKFSPEHSSRQQIKNALENSLMRMKRDHVDVYQPHWPTTNEESFVEVLETLVELQQVGKILHIGLSNHTAKHLSQARSIIPNNPVLFIQSEYNLIERSAEETLIPEILMNDGAFIAYSPLREGQLLQSDKMPELRQLANQNNCSPAQLLLAWVIRKAPVIAIPKSTNFKRVRENAEVMELKISSGDLNALSELFKVLPLAILPKRISVSTDNSGDRLVYTNLADAKANIYNLTPGPMQIAEEILACNGQLNKPIKVRKLKDSEDYTLVEGRLKYWAWVILYGDNKPIPAIIQP